MNLSVSRPPKASAWLETLDREPDPELRGAGLLQVACEMAQEDPAFAFQILSALLQDPTYSLDLQSQAKTRLDLLAGRGELGPRMEQWTQGFLNHAIDPASLVAMTAGSLAFRLVRLGVAKKLLAMPARFVTRGFLAKGLATGAGFSAEVTAFTVAGRALGPDFATAWAHDFSRASLSLGALKSFGALGKSAPNAAMLGGIMFGGVLEKNLGLRETNLELWEGLATLLHFKVAASLTRTGLGERFARWELGMEQRFQESAPRLPSLQGPSYAWATSGFGAPLAIRSSAPSHVFLAERHGTGESGLLPAKVRSLEEKYLRLFPKNEEGGLYSNDIIKHACRIRCDLPGFHENLLEALFQQGHRGGLSQLHTVLAIERVFATDALANSRGSFGYAQLQLLLGHVLSEPHKGRRQEAMRAILTTFERGFSRSDSLELLERFTQAPRSVIQETPTYDEAFHQRHSVDAGRFWESYRTEDIVPLFNFVHRKAGRDPETAQEMIAEIGTRSSREGLYFSSEVDAALDHARLHPFGNLVLDRFYHIMAAGDLPGKLRELAGEPSKISTDRYVEALTRSGHARGKIAEILNGSVHTAYFNDLRLADKVVSVFQELAPYFQKPEYRDANRNRLLGQFYFYAKRQQPIHTIELFRLLKTGRYAQAEFFEQAWRDGEFRVDLLSKQQFQEEVHAWGGTKDCEWSLFVQGLGGARDRILIRELPELKFSTQADRDLAFSETLWRLRGLAHELEHWRHFSGRSASGLIRPFQLQNISREERLVTEVMAYLEEFRWRAMNSDDHYWQISRRLGDSLPLFLRNVAEESYF